jgi:hypothetical protein
MDALKEIGKTTFGWNDELAGLLGLLLLGGIAYLSERLRLRFLKVEPRRRGYFAGYCLLAMLVGFGISSGLYWPVILQLIAFALGVDLAHWHRTVNRDQTDKRARTFTLEPSQAAPDMPER